MSIMRSTAVDVVVDLDRIRSNAEAIREQTGRPLIAVVKADGYGCGAAEVADALSPVVQEFAFFNLDEVRHTQRPGLIIGPPVEAPAAYRELSQRPTMMSLGDARRFRGERVAVSVDTGMQRFGCDPAELNEIFTLCRVHDLYTHPQNQVAAVRLAELGADRGALLHAAATSLLSHPETWLDAVRPGFALYRGAVRVSTPLYAAYDTTRNIGYTGFDAPRVGIILAGYSQLLQAGPVAINGRRQHLLEIGMNSAFVSIDPRDKAGDEVVLLGDEINEQDVAAYLRVRPHEVLCRYATMGPRRHTLSGREKAAVRTFVMA